MTYGITGNTGKERLWQPVSGLIDWFEGHGLSYVLESDVADGLVARGLQAADLCQAHTAQDPALESDVILSFGGDGTLLNAAHEIGVRQVPILGVNIGRLGFLADIEVNDLHRTIERLEAGDYRIEGRTVLAGRTGDGPVRYALNEFVLKREGSAGLISVRVTVDGRYLNTYWADGLIIATSTGSTAYSLSAGGPIIEPGSGVVVITPIAPHTLTVRPILVPNTARIEARVESTASAFTLSSDGRGGGKPGDPAQPIVIQKADYVVNLVKLPEQQYYDTLRKKLRWG